MYLVIKRPSFKKYAFPPPPILNTLHTPPQQPTIDPAILSNKKMKHLNLSIFQNFQLITQ